ncbi:hypothetical protein BHU72_15135 [Desulfuribacillus stibiiarsenatis]|uniref:DnaB/C C-terminal domain-containing protein n=1 Tax=Desulfuribacillus stibiiarsenatis TaxID=1390249 RepID=A0A1E5L5Z5_9FIRM|nr:DnaD domain protein [Desulfuribacillus stibiiarsenatis]OEH85550.1 hypothetical protein BHU72_15135 [Desulfuribacillus stibiiarsenatis]
MNNKLGNSKGTLIKKRSLDNSIINKEKLYKYPNACRLYNERFSKNGSFPQQVLFELLNDYNEEKVVEAMKIAVEKGAFTSNYIRGILKKRKENDLKTRKITHRNNYQKAEYDWCKEFLYPDDSGEKR